MTQALLADWDNFYVITGSSAAGLTGLTFVVIALVADAQRVKTDGLSAFVTPTIVHFSTVLALAAFMSVPHQNELSVSLGVGIAGVAGLIYAAMIALQMRRNMKDYIPVGEDWLWHVILPAVVYATFIAMAILLVDDVMGGLYGVAAASMLLLFIGIHNAWDIAVWISVRGQRDSKPTPD